MLLLISMWDFWIFLVTFLLFFLFAYAEDDDGFSVGASTFILIVALLFWHWLGEIRYWAWIKENWSIFLLSIPIYFSIGVSWSLGKWYLLLRTKHEKMMKDWPECRNGWSSWEKYVANHRPKAADHKGQIIYWISYWPISMLWAVVADAIRGFGRLCYRWVSGIYEKISNKMFSVKEPE